jgi:hypothetical protein
MQKSNNDRMEKMVGSSASPSTSICRISSVTGVAKTRIWGILHHDGFHHGITSEEYNTSYWEIMSTM